MAVRLPKEGEAKKTAKKTATKKAARKLKVGPSPTSKGANVQAVQNDALSPEDVIEYGITVEVSPGKGQKAWVRFASTSSVRDGETTDQARARVTTYVNEEIDRRIDELS